MNIFEIDDLLSPEHVSTVWPEWPVDMNPALDLGHSDWMTRKEFFNIRPNIFTCQIPELTEDIRADIETLEDSGWDVLVHGNTARLYRA